MRGKIERTKKNGKYRNRRKANKTKKQNIIKEEK